MRAKYVKYGNLRNGEHFQFCTELKNLAAAGAETRYHYDHAIAEAAERPTLCISPFNIGEHTIRNKFSKIAMAATFGFAFAFAQETP